MLQWLMMENRVPEPRVVHWKKEPYNVYIGRPSKWGNPFIVGTRGMSHADAVSAYRNWINSSLNITLREAAKKELRGKILGCWCAPKPCHGDVLLEIANG